MSVIKKTKKSAKFLGELAAQMFGVPTMTGKYSKTGDKIKAGIKKFEEEYLPLSKHFGYKPQKRERTDWEKKYLPLSKYFKKKK